MKPDQLNAIIGRNVKFRRKELGLNQQAVGSFCGVSAERISQIEHAHCGVPSSMLAVLSECLQCSVAYLVSEDSVPTSENLKFANVIA